jgi:hypothetical protein
LSHIIAGGDRTNFCVHRPKRDVKLVDMLAVEAPIKKLVAVGGVALLIAAGVALRSHRAHAHGHHHHHHRLTLHAPREPGAIYYTVFAQGDVMVPDRPGLWSELTDASKPFHINSHIQTPDGCYWDVSETLTVTDPSHFAYAYDETPTGCAPDSVPSYIATPRTGVVAIDE